MTKKVKNPVEHETEESPYLLGSGRRTTAESPFEEYPGRVSFPPVMTIDLYRTYVDIATESTEENFRTIFATADGETLITSLRSIKVALAFATAELTDEEGQPISLSLEESPAILLGWLGLLGEEWIAKTARFPRLRNPSVEIPSEAE